MNKILLIILAITIFQISTVISFAQDIQWNSAPKKGFVFEISNKEAQKLLTCTKPDTIVNKLLHNLIDTFDVDKGWVNRPAKGHFILAKIVENKLYCDYTCVFPYQVFLLKEYDALALQVVDLKGNVRDDAKVKFKFKRLRIDPESKTYRLENDWFNGNSRTATIELDGFRSFFNILKHEIPSWHDNYNNDNGPDFYSYMITDKNKYKPNDRVRFKSYALSQFKLPLHKDLEVWLTDYRKNIKVGKITPYRPGGYASEFQLHDSLKLSLDKNYYLQLREKNGRIVAACSFKYEDYELFGNKLEIQLAKSSQFYPEKNELTITATDVNGLKLKDAKASILVKTQAIHESFQPLVILPDTLLYSQIDLDPINPTHLDIPSALFQKTNTSYQVFVTVLNSENERMERNDMATHFYSQYELSTHFSNDSICFDLLKNGGQMQNVPIKLWHSGELEPIEIHLPYKEKLNPALSYFRLENELVSKQISISHLSPYLDVVGGIQKDSFNIRLQNAQKLDVSWYIYQGSNLLKKGFGKELDYKSFIEDRTTTFYVEFLYSFGGEDHIKRTQYEFKEEFLDVSLNMPDKVYPGQQVDATILVRDQLGQPVRGVDLTALAITGKLNYHLPDLPYYGRSSAPRSIKAHYSKEALNKRTAILNLDYRKWEKTARLDTMTYYRFTYPKSGFFKYFVFIADSTQFAPFIMQNGTAKKIYAIEVDHHPVYFSWVDQPKEYSFYISPGKKHEISLRLFDQEIVLDSISFKAGKKTILSCNFDNLPQGTKIYNLGHKFTQTETNRYYEYVASFKIGLGSGYVEAVNEFTPLFINKNSPYSGKGYIIAGPVSPGMNTYSESWGLKTNYKHTGGYRYTFEDNIVYKQDETNLLPKHLEDNFSSPLSVINAKAMNKKRFLEKKPELEYKWNARTIDIVNSHSRIKFLLPFEKESSGIAAIIFQDVKTKKSTAPCYNKLNEYRSDLYYIPSGTNDIAVLYNNGKYLKMDSINFKKNIVAVIDLNHSSLNPIDSLSKSWLLSHSMKYPDDCYPLPIEAKYPANKYFFSQGLAGNVKGVVYDENHEPLPGVNIVVEGTTMGAVSDLDGKFSLDIYTPTATLVFSFVGYLPEKVEVTRGSEVIMKLTPDVQKLEEVVVVGYGTMSKSDLTGSVAGMAAVDTAPEDKPEAEQNNQDDKIIREAEQHLYQELLTLNSIRSNFSDVGFWEPRLFTDKRGESKFKVTFPDDITRWDALVYAMNSKIQTGTLRKSIRSYKPLMAELKVPQFLTRGDTSYFLGKVLNYTSDSSIVGKVKWSGAKTGFEKNIQFANFHSDKLQVNVNSTDSIKTRYEFTSTDGYFDGEERTVPVVEQGIIRADGSLSILKNGDDKYVKASDNETVTVQIMDNQIQIYGEEVSYLLNYRYACNEQLASKLVGLVTNKLLMQYEGKPFKYDKDVNKIISRLLKNQNQEFLWSWWDISPNSCYWMSAHILRSLKCAKDAGYRVDLDIDNIARKAQYKFNFFNQYSIEDIDLLHSLAGWHAGLDYRKCIHVLDSMLCAKEYPMDSKAINYYSKYSHLKEKFLLQEIKQMVGFPYQPDTLLKYKKEGILGEVYFSDNKPTSYWYDDNMAANVIAYRILKKDSLLKHMLVNMQLYFLSTRRNGAWNTYQSSNILMSVLPDLLAEGFSKGHTASVIVQGKENATITKFPYHIELNPDEELKVHKQSGLPLYYMQYVNERVTRAKTGVDGFEIKTYFNNGGLLLEAGKPVSLTVTVTVKKDAAFENVMIEVPIPGACSYADKRQPYCGVETHREYFKERTLIFCENMKTGNYEFNIQLLPRFTGKYLMNPAQVSLMYVPVVNANTNIKQVEVKD